MESKTKSSGVASYEQVDDEYLKRRKLRKSAGWILLWALGVGAVISGDFAGWNTGLMHGGFWGLAIATFLMAIMYVCMVFTIAELSAALPHAGGFFSFTRNALGPTDLPPVTVPVVKLLFAAPLGQPLHFVEA